MKITKQNLKEFAKTHNLEYVERETDNCIFLNIPQTYHVKDEDYKFAWFYLDNKDYRCASSFSISYQPRGYINENGINAIKELYNF